MRWPGELSWSLNSVKHKYLDDVMGLGAIRSNTWSDALTSDLTWPDPTQIYVLNSLCPVVRVTLVIDQRGNVVLATTANGRKFSHTKTEDPNSGWLDAGVQDVFNSFFHPYQKLPWLNHGKNMVQPSFMVIFGRDMCPKSDVIIWRTLPSSSHVPIQLAEVRLLTH